MDAGHFLLDENRYGFVDSGEISDLKFEKVQ